MSKILLILGLLAFLHPAQADSGVMSSNYRVAIPQEASQLVFEVTQEMRDRVRLRRASLSCEGDCDGFVPYSEETLDNILSVQFESDGRGLMFVTWVTGSAYRMQAFSVSRQGLVIRLEVGSRALPAVLNISGEVVLILLAPEDEKGESCLKGMQWNGSDFIPKSIAELGISMNYRDCL